MISKWLRWWWLPLAILAGLGLARLRFDVEVLNLLPADLPVVEGLRLYQRHFASADELVLTIGADDAEAATEVARELAVTLRAQTNLIARALWQPPGQEHPEQVPELLALMWLNQPPETFRQLANKLAPSKLTNILAETREALATTLSPNELARLGYDPFGLSRTPAASTGGPGRNGQGEEFFASADGAFRLLFLQPAHAFSSYRDCGRWLDAVRNTVEEFRHRSQLPATIRFGYTGAPAFIAETSSGMERDLKVSALGTLVVVAALFWLAHRRWLPLCWLIMLLVAVVGGTLALGGLVFGTLNVVSLGFAAILLGLSVDYALVLYQAARDRPQSSHSEVRREIAPGILGSALTTACAFALLNFAALPGLGQLGTLVAIGIVLGALVMLGAFLPVAAKRSASAKDETSEQDQARPAPAGALAGSDVFTSAAIPATVLLAVVTAIILWQRTPSVDHTSEALSPVGSPAYLAMAEIKTRLGQTNEPLWLLVSGRDESQVAQRLDLLEARLGASELAAWISEVTLPSALWPRPEWQRANRELAGQLAAQRETLRLALRKNGFTDEAFALTAGVLDTWEKPASDSTPRWPILEANRWILEKVSARTDDGWVALGVVRSPTNSAAAFAGVTSAVGAELSRQGAVLTGWPALGEALLQHTGRRLPGVVVAMAALVALCLWLTFRTVREVLLSFGVILAGFAGLLVVMSVCGWSWNLLNLMAVPLLLGAGVDYTIHLQLALRRRQGDTTIVRRTTGRALLLCAGTTIVGFTSLTWAGNAGLASLGKVCAAGVACVLFASLILLPGWWRCLMAGRTAPSKPSSLYRAEIWRLGLLLGRVLPVRCYRWLSRGLAWLYDLTQPRRREVVITNLLPVFNGDRAAAERVARRLFQQFALKVGDLWRYESGVSVDHWLTVWSGWEIFAAAQARGKGVLLVTPHLGNWEFGGAILVQKGHRLLVLTQAEPEQQLTELRQSSRARYGIETLVVGENAFAFVEIIKCLQAGATVALLVDRPPPPTAVTVELFGRPFRASIAAAELARASGCAIIPTYVIRNHDGYEAHLLPEITYDRAAIGDRASRLRLTQEIVRAFEPAIRQHVDQWYHFVPIWP